MQDIKPREDQKNIIEVSNGDHSIKYESSKSIAEAERIKQELQSKITIKTGDTLEDFF